MAAHMSSLREGERFECQPSGLSGEAGNEMSESTETSGNPLGAAAPIEVADSYPVGAEGESGELYHSA